MKWSRKCLAVVILRTAILRPSALNSATILYAIFSRNMRIDWLPWDSHSNCGRRKKTPFSCKTRFCLSCARNHLEEWVTKIKSIMLKGIRHRHIILTMPDKLWSYFKKYRSLLKVLSDAADLLIKDILKFYKKKDALIPGIISVAQTSSRRCTFNPHLHLLVTEGGLLFPSKGTSAGWYPLTFIKSEVLSHKWQYFLLTSLKPHLPATPETRKLIDELFKL